MPFRRLFWAVSALAIGAVVGACSSVSTDGDAVREDAGDGGGLDFDGGIGPDGESRTDGGRSPMGPTDGQSDSASDAGRS